MPRPSLGERKAFTIRAPLDVVAALEASGGTANENLVRILRRGLGVKTESPDLSSLAAEAAEQVLEYLDARLAGGEPAARTSETSRRSREWWVENGERMRAQLREGSRRRIEERNSGMAAMRAAGKPDEEIAAVYRVTAGKVRQILGGESRARRERAQVWDAERVQTLARMRDEGMTLQQVGDAFGVSRERVRQILDVEAERRGRPFPHAGPHARRCSGCGKKIARVNTTGFCKECRPRRPRDWTMRAVERGIYRRYSPSQEIWDGDYYVHDSRDPETHAQGRRTKVRRFSGVEEARAFRAKQAEERPFKQQYRPPLLGVSDKVLLFFSGRQLLGRHEVSIPEVAGHLGDTIRAPNTVASLFEKGLIERVGTGRTGVYALSEAGTRRVWEIRLGQRSQYNGRQGHGVKEAAEILGVSASTVRNRIRDGSLQAERDGRLVVISPSALAAYKAEIHPVGIEHHSAKLNEDAVRAIRTAVAAGESKASVARRYGVTRGTVIFIVQRKTWRHVE
jgi:excisionase family DNA binding protein